MSLKSLLDFDADMDEMLAEFERETAERRAWTSEMLMPHHAIKTQTEVSPPSRFNVLSLPAWLEIAKRASVPAIPAREIHSFPADVLDAAIDQDSQAGEAMDRHERKIINALGEGDILRFEHVAPMEIKSSMSRTGQMSRGVFHSPHHGRDILDIYGDERFHDTFRAFGETVIRAYARPYVAPMSVPGLDDPTCAWPVEFRVYVRGGAIIGISNYYPQCSLHAGDDAEFKALIQTAIDQCLAKSSAMLETMRRLNIGVGNWDHSRNPHDPNAWGAQDWTLDFILTETKDILFLEGGPGFFPRGGAHPCCFLKDGSAILPDALKTEGVALSRDTPNVPLPPF